MIRRHKDESRAQSSHISVPVPQGLTYLPFQLAGIEYASKRDRTLIADEMGLGKTIQAIGLVNVIQPQRILVICPASLKINWTLEFEKWGVQDLRSTYIRGRKDGLVGDVCVINYELLSAYGDQLRATPWDLLIIDEAHYLKSAKADRTAQVFGRRRAKGAKPKISPIPWARLLILTGTPILNKPKELWPLLQVLDPEGLGSDWFYFAKRYCKLFEIEQFDASKGRKVHVGWKWDGADNLDELQAIMRERFMLRRLKKDVLRELPPKTRQVIVLDAKKGLTKLLERERMDYDSYVKVHGAVVLESPAFIEIAKIRKEVALAKVPYVIEYLKEVMDENSKIVVFTYHHEVFDSIAAAFGSIATGFDGRTSIAKRQNSIELFQSDAPTRLFIGGIQAAGVGITLTAASIAVFAELDWVPANVTQAEDRLHRIGQKENVLVRHIVLNNSLDQRIAQAIIQKQEIADKALDNEKSNP